ARRLDDDDGRLESPPRPSQRPPQPDASKRPPAKPVYRRHAADHRQLKPSYPGPSLQNFLCQRGDFIEISGDLGRGWRSLLLGRFSRENFLSRVTQGQIVNAIDCRASGEKLV